MKDKIEKLLTARELSLKARAIIKQNLFISLGAITIMAVSAIFGIVPLTLGVILTITCERVPKRFNGIVWESMKLKYEN